jgi:hypothetical protein
MAFFRVVRARKKSKYHKNKQHKNKIILALSFNNLTKILVDSAIIFFKSNSKFAPKPAMPKSMKPERIPLFVYICSVAGHSTVKILQFWLKFR